MAIKDSRTCFVFGSFFFFQELGAYIVQVMLKMTRHLYFDPEGAGDMPGERGEEGGDSIYFNYCSLHTHLIIYLSRNNVWGLMYLRASRI